MRSFRKRKRCLFCVTPPASMTLPFSILALLRKSATLTAITSLSDRTMSPVVASLLLRRCVQSLFMNTEQREESLKTRHSSEISSASTSPIFILASCCLKNSPVPEAHLFPEKLVMIFLYSSRVYTIRSSPPRETSASTFWPISCIASSIHRGSMTLLMFKRWRPSVPVAIAGISGGTSRPERIFLRVSRKFPSCGSTAYHKMFFPFKRAALTLEEPILIPRACIKSPFDNNPCGQYYESIVSSSIRCFFALSCALARAKKSS